MRYLTLFFCIVLFSFGEVNSSVGKQTIKEPAEVLHKPDFIYKKKGWELKIWYTAKGSRSEGTFGKLYHNGKEVRLEKEGETCQTPFGELHFITSGFLWGAHGWTFTEEDQIPPPSWQEK